MSRSAWMLGASGMGVGPLALYLKSAGWEVSGWDDGVGSPMELHLANAEIPLLRDPWAAGRRPAVVGRSSAVKPGHPALALAEADGARILRRGELLAEAVADRRFVAVCGSHGKTTTCGLLVAALTAAKADFGYVLGGLFRDPSFPPARASATSPWVVAEVGESDGTISAFSLAKPSGNPILDQSVVEAARKVIKIAPVPEGMGGGGGYTININFDLE